MPQAIELRQETLTLISLKTDVPTADLRAMLEDWQAFESDSNNPLVIVFDFHAPNGKHITWADMSKKVFADHFKFVFEPPNPNKFEAVTTL